MLQAAVARYGGKDEALIALGQASLVPNRNHHRVLRRELERLELLEKAVRG